MKLTKKFMKESYPNMQKMDWRNLKFRAPRPDEALFLSKRIKGQNNYPVLRATVIKTYGYTSTAWEVFEFISLLGDATTGAPVYYYAVVRINGTNIITETLLSDKERRILQPGDDVLVVKKSDKMAYSYKVVSMQ